MYLQVGGEEAVEKQLTENEKMLIERVERAKVEWMEVIHEQDEEMMEVKMLQETSQTPAEAQATYDAINLRILLTRQAHARFLEKQEADEKHMKMLVGWKQADMAAYYSIWDMHLKEMDKDDPSKLSELGNWETMEAYFSIKARESALLEGRSRTQAEFDQTIKVEMGRAKVIIDRGVADGTMVRPVVDNKKKPGRPKN